MERQVDEHSEENDDGSSLVDLFDTLLAFAHKRNTKVLDPDELKEIARLDNLIADRCRDAGGPEIPDFPVREPSVRLMGFTRVPYNNVTKITMQRHDEGGRKETPQGRSVIIYNLRAWVDAIRVARHMAEEMGS